MEVSDEQVMGDRWNRRGRWRRSDGGPATTPILDWKLIYNIRDSAGGSRGHRGGVPAAVSARKLAAVVWELAATTNCGGGVRWLCGLSDELGFEFPSSSTIPKFATEGFTKWDINSHSKASAYANHFQTHKKLLNNHETTTISVASSAELFKSQKWSRTRPKHVMQKHDEEETSSSTKTKHHQISAIIKNLKDDVRRERKTCKKMYTANAKLQNDIVEAKSLATMIMHNYEKEKKARQLLEDICNKQAERIEAYKAEIEELRDQCARIQDEVVEEREMLQIADSWREERAQMKLVDAKFILGDKYGEMNDLIEDLKTFLRSSSFDTDVNEISNFKRVEKLLYTLSKCGEEFTIAKDSEIGDDEDEVY